MMEADPGLNWNVTGRLDRVSWENILAVAKLVRSIAPVARVIAVGGYSDLPLSDYTEHRDYDTFGLDTPATGFYVNGGLQVQHLGVEIDHSRQLPELAAAQGLKVALVGKAADILETDSIVERRPAVDTQTNLKNILDLSTEKDLVIGNIQETDLAGHQQNPGMYCEVLELIDAGILEIITRMQNNDELVVISDHGNDPLIGHSYHTREYVPCLWVKKNSDAESLGIEIKLNNSCSNLADIGASMAFRLGCGEVAYGNISFPKPELGSTSGCRLR